MSIVDPKLQVFLCHASQDKSAVRELYNTLKSEKWIDPWLDKAKILPGQDWRMVIEKAVEESDVVIVCLSNQSVNKEGYIQKEIRYAYDIALEKPEEIIFLIPLRLEECNAPRGLRTLQWVNYFGSEKNEHYTNLLEALKLRYEQRLPFKIDELAQKQRQEKDHQEYEEYQRREQEKARLLIEEQERRDAEKRAKLEAEEWVNKELARKKARQELQEREKREGEERARKQAEENLNQIHYSVNDAIEPRKNSTSLIIAIITIIFALLCCSIFIWVWFFGDQFINSLQ